MSERRRSSKIQPTHKLCCLVAFNELDWQGAGGKLSRCKVKQFDDLLVHHVTVSTLLYFQSCCLKSSCVLDRTCVACETAWRVLIGLRQG